MTLDQTMDATLEFIGTIHSPLKSIEDCPLQEAEGAPGASIAIFPEFTAGIQNINAGTNVMLLTWLHKADRSVIKCVTRNNYQSPKIGVFSTRSPDRPNPIGVHVAKVISVEGNMLRVAALEVLDQTPVVDIKPVLD